MNKRLGFRCVMEAVIGPVVVASGGNARLISVIALHRRCYGGVGAHNYSFTEQICSNEITVIETYCALYYRHGW